MNKPNRQPVCQVSGSTKTSLPSQQQSSAHRTSNLSATQALPNKPSQREPSCDIFNSSSISSAVDLVQCGYESQISIPSNAAWRCSTCRNTYAIQCARIDRPLGYFWCRTCHCSAAFDTLNIPQLRQITGMEYELAVPHQPEASQSSLSSIFIWVCCTCGRSWPQVPALWRASLPTSQMASSVGRSVLWRIFHLRSDHFARESNPAPALVDLRACARYIVAFKNGCLCAHYTCTTCFRAMVLAEGENVSRRLQEEEAVGIPQETLERKKYEIRAMGLDPDEYFP